MAYEGKEQAGPLFADAARRLARRGHPETSQRGAEDAAGRLGQMRQAVLEAVTRHPGLTASELERAEGVLGRTYGRRLPELAAHLMVRRGEARPCTVTGRAATTWWPAS
jgi:hypothetical protein